MTVKWAPFLSVSPFPFLFKIHFLSPFPCPHADHSMHFPTFAHPPGWEHKPSFFSATGTPLLIPCSFLLFLPSCEIAVVSYGFLFLRDGRWVHVGVEATKHAVSAQRAGQHTQWASCGYDSCHVHMTVLPIIKNLHSVKIVHHLEVVIVPGYIVKPDLRTLHWTIGLKTIVQTVQ